ncbi:hypothetical protein [Acidisphaera sp. S103]|nr:hypothetical protein [Acidisphaera sp. S103]
MDKKTEQMIYDAALRATHEMGSDLLKMSCFVSNWKQQAEIVPEKELEAA